MRGYSAPYIKLYLVDQDFSGTLMGSILSLAALVELLLLPTLSRYADRKNHHRLMWRSMMLTYVLACVAIVLFPYTVVLGAGLLASEVSKRTTLVYSLQLSFTKIQETGRGLHGRVRSAAAGGFMVANATAGVIFHFGKYFGIFSAAFITGLMSIYASKVMPEATFDENTIEIEVGDPSERNPALYVFLFSQFLAAIGTRGGLLFWLIHFQENLGIVTWQIAFLVTISALLEIPWMVYMDRLLKQFLAIRLYTVGVIGIAGFLIFVGILPSFVWIFIALMIRAPAFSLSNVAALYHINKISSPQNVATNLTLSQITIPSTAGLLTSAPMGYAYDALPAHLFFGLCAGMLMLSAITIFTYQILSRSSERISEI